MVDATRITDAQLGAGDHNNDNCADLALDVNGERTWLLPHVQPARLQKAPLHVPPLDSSAPTSTAPATADARDDGGAA